MKPYGSWDNYIRKYREEIGISQDELAILIGLEGRGAISLFESALRIPDLARLIALELIFEEPIQVIFAGIAEDVRDDVKNRAWALLEGGGEKTTAENVDKLRTLARLARLGDDNALPCGEVV